MTQDEIIRMAREAGIEADESNGYLEWWNFAKLVATHEKKFWMEQIEVECNEAVLAEREACAKVCEDIIASVITKPMPLRDIVAAIRARSEK